MSPEAELLPINNEPGAAGEEAIAESTPFRFTHFSHCPVSAVDAFFKRINPIFEH